MQAQLAYAQSNLERTERLKTSGTSTADRMDQAIANRNELAAKNAEIEAGLLQTQIKLQKTNLIAPFDGFIGTRHLDEGNFVGAGAPVLTIFQANQTRFRVGLPSDVDPSGFERSEIEISGDTYPATLAAIRPDIDPVTRLRSAIYNITDTAEHRFGEAGVLKARIPLDLTGAWVPVSALQAGVGDTWTIFIVDDNNIARTVMVEILHIGTDRAVVFGAFDDGDQVIVNGVHKLSPGQPVEPV